MGYPVILTPQSQEDLAAIVQFIALDNPDRARTYGNLLIDKCTTRGKCCRLDPSLIT